MPTQQHSQKSRALRTSFLRICLMIIASFWVGTSPKAFAQTAPWLEPGGPACFESWISEAMGRLNAYDRPGEFNRSKPFTINQYAVVVGRGDRSNYAPDDWEAYGRNRYARIWGKFRANPDVGWRWADWNRAGVPHLAPFMRQCLASGSASRGAPPPAAAPITPQLRQACDAYARRAVDQTREYQRRRCTGGRPEWWSTNYAVHNNWCLGRPNNPTPSEGTFFRDEVLGQCGGAPSSTSGGPSSASGGQPGDGRLVLRVARPAGKRSAAVGAVCATWRSPATTERGITTRASPTVRAAAARNRGASRSISSARTASACCRT